MTRLGDMREKSKKKKEWKRRAYVGVSARRKVKRTPPSTTLRNIRMGKTGVGVGFEYGGEGGGFY